VFYALYGKIFETKNKEQTIFYKNGSIHFFALATGVEEK